MIGGLVATAVSGWSVLVAGFDPASLWGTEVQSFFISKHQPAVTPVQPSEPQPPHVPGLTVDRPASEEEELSQVAASDEDSHGADERH